MACVLSAVPHLCAWRNGRLDGGVVRDRDKGRGDAALGWQKFAQQAEGATCTPSTVFRTTFRNSPVRQKAALTYKYPTLDNKRRHLGCFELQIMLCIPHGTRTQYQETTQGDLR